MRSSYRAQLIALTAAATFIAAPVSAMTTRPISSHPVQFVQDHDKGVGHKVKDKTVTTGKKVGHQTKKLFSKTGEEITDAWVLTKVKSSFVGEKQLERSDINVDVRDRGVTLRGTVSTVAGRNRAAVLAKQVEGVTTVTNRLVVVR